ncbi:MAG: hypothetical protein GWN87_17720 [Desulfuromonadales bacterium]|nr:hypothetical protein [Desulfuromonadales bacterium]NIS40510.1 hypothetical protein [Desulfuromonadales bacterium]
MQGKSGSRHISQRIKLFVKFNFRLFILKDKIVKQTFDKQQKRLPMLRENISILQHMSFSNADQNQPCPPSSILDALMRVIVPIFLFLFFLTWNSWAAGDEEQKNAVTFSGISGWYQFASEQNLTDHLFYGINIGYAIRDKDFMRSMDIELSGLTVETEKSPDGRRTDVNVFSLEALFPLLPEKKSIPYLTIGAGVLLVDHDAGEEENLALSYGFGFKKVLSEDFFLRLEARHHFIGDHDHVNNFQYSAGLTYLFGQPKKEKPKPLPDADGDGVPDERDACPETPKDFDIDKRGCPIDPPDTDSDGVPDYRDECGQTPAGSKVDSAGCPFDEDGDGIFDHHDKCPGTPEDLKVNPQGCVDLRSD